MLSVVLTINYNLKKIVSFSFIMLSGIILFAQESSCTSGGIATGSAGSVTYSVGQIIYSLNCGIIGSAAQALAVEEMEDSLAATTTGLNENFGKIDVAVFPNPASNFLIISTTGINSQEDLTYSLFDQNGILIKSGAVSESETSIDVSNLAAASYFLHVTDKHNKINKFKIHKN